MSEKITAEQLALAEKRLRIQVNEFVDPVARAMICSGVTYDEVQRAERYLKALESLR